MIKLVQALGLFLMGFGALGLLKTGWADAVERWLEQLSMVEGHRIAASLAGQGLHLLQGATSRTIMAAAAGSFIYGGIFIVEAVGLWRLKRWAEYLTIAVTASLLPLEVFAVWREVTELRVGAVVLNSVVVAYLAWQLYATRDKHSLVSPRIDL